MQARYQYGTLTRRKRKRGPDVWQWRWFEGGRRKSVLIGTVEKLPTRVDAERASEAHRIKVNAEIPQAQFHAVTVGALIDRFISDEMPKRCRYATQESYKSDMERYIRPRWGMTVLRKIKALAIEDWLASLKLVKFKDRDASPSTKADIRNLMHLLFQCARRWELIDYNPIELVRQSSKRRAAPRILDPGEFVALLDKLKAPYRLMVLVAGCLGLRASEVMGLQWLDFDWDNLTVFIRRSVVHGRVGETKTEASAKPLPLDPDLATELMRWNQEAVYKVPTDFVFANDKGKPRWQETILEDYIKPAAVAAKIGKVGWHTFRHTYATMLHDLGTNLAVQKELLRHADIQTTMNIYTQAVAPAKREAQQRVAKVLLKK